MRASHIRPPPSSTAGPSNQADLLEAGESCVFLVGIREFSENTDPNIVPYIYEGLKQCTPNFWKLP